MAPGNYRWPQGIIRGPRGNIGGPQGEGGPKGDYRQPPGGGNV